MILLLLLLLIIIIIIIIIIRVAFHWGLSDSKNPQDSRTYLTILTDVNNALVWIVSARILISKFSSPFSKVLGIVPSALITIP